MTWQVGFTLAVLAVLLYGLVRFPHVVDVIFLGALSLFAVVGIITPAEAVAGFSNEGMLTVGALFVVAAGLTETGVIGRIARRVMAHDTRPRLAIARTAVPVAVMSTFLNNTTVVAMCLPVLLDWCRKHRMAASKLLIPLSYAAILGGVCTLIGTSTNLVVHGMLKSAGMQGMGMWELSKVGIPVAVVGTLLLILVGPRLLPDRKEFLEQIGESRREFLVELVVRSSCPLIGQSIADAGLRHLPGLFLIEIERDGQLIAPVGPEERLELGDRLVFTGVVSTIVDLQRIPGLVPATDDRGLLSSTGRKDLCEAVISTSSPLIGQGVREANFRTIYDAAVVAVHRNGERLRQKIGDIVLRPGDTLLLLTGPGFARAHRNNPDFLLVSEAGDVTPERHDRAWLAGFITLALIAAMTLPDIAASFGWQSPPVKNLDRLRVIFVFLAAGAMVVTRCVTSVGARRSIEWQVLLVIGASFGLGKALEHSGTAKLLAGLVVQTVGAWGPLAALAAIYAVTWLLTELMSNNAAAALMFPFAISTAQQFSVEPRGFAIAVALGASAGFLLPVGYQTHLMVFGPGGYRSWDFVRIGLPMVLVWFVVSMLCIPVYWPLTPVR